MLFVFHNVIISVSAAYYLQLKDDGTELVKGMTTPSQLTVSQLRNGDGSVKK